mmetsp:Transcript_10903/g.17862  ORF Transcript_10903/g.17862 Transcript_10903/m.17862 type:complete len:321 (+) Transcript_10903:7-969(+)
MKDQMSGNPSHELSEWETVWRLLDDKTLPLSSPQNFHVSLRRFDAFTTSVANLEPGSYRVYVYVFRHQELENAELQEIKQQTGKEEAAALPLNHIVETQHSASVETEQATARRNSLVEAELGAKSRRGSSTSRKISEKMRSALQAATFGGIGKLDVNLDFMLMKTHLNGGQSAVLMPIIEKSAVIAYEEYPVLEFSFTVSEGDSPATAYFRFKCTSTVTVLNVAAQIFKKKDVAPEKESAPPSKEGCQEDETLDTATKIENERMLRELALFVGFSFGISSASTVHILFVVLIISWSLMDKIRLELGTKLEPEPKKTTASF